MVFQVESENLLEVRITKPKSRESLKKFANKIREILGLSTDQLFVDVLLCLEVLIPKIDPDFQFVILEANYINRPNEAFFHPKNNTVYVRSDIYEKAGDEDGRARFTIAHEIAHYFLFKNFGIPYFENWEKVMNNSDPTLHSMDPEWQADVVANYLLCESDSIRDLSEEDIVFYCGVSHNAAYTAWRNANGKKYVDYSAIFKGKSFTDFFADCTK